MTTTIAMLEKLMNSEVDNLHLRIDRFEAVVEKIFDRLDIIDHHITLLWSAVDELREGLKNCATKDDLRSLVTKEEAKNFATKDDLKGLMTKEDAKQFATKDDVEQIIITVLQRFGFKPLS